MQKYCLFRSGEGGTGGCQAIIAYLVKIQDKDKESCRCNLLYQVSVYFTFVIDKTALDMELS
jgi:hypothetical protein